MKSQNRSRFLFNIHIAIQHAQYEIKIKTSAEKKHTIKLITSFEDENQVIYAQIERTIFISYKKFKRKRDDISKNS